MSEEEWRGLVRQTAWFFVATTLIAATLAFLLGFLIGRLTG